VSEFVLHRGHVILPKDGRLSTLIPHAQTVRHTDGREFVIVPHSLDETKVLHNLGIKVPPPILSQYQWPGPPPFDAQRITAAHITQHPRCFVLNGMGTGKTRAALYAFDFMRQTGAVSKLLVTAPLSTLRQTWQRELTLYFPHLTSAVLHKDGKNADWRRNELARDVDVYIINHDGAKLIVDDLIKRRDIDMLVLDELTEYKNTRSEMWKITNKLAQRMPRVVGMTGSPMAKDPTDVYGQVKIVDASRAGRSFTDFRDKVMTKLTAFKWVAKQDHVETVHRFMQPSVRFARSDCFDLPPVQYVRREVPLSHQQAKLYKAMSAECAAEVAAGTIKAVNEADRINKLVQICTGFAYDTEHRVVGVDCADRLAALDEAITQSEGKVIIFTPYKASLALLQEHLDKCWTTSVISGDVPAGQRERIFTAFRHSPDPKVLIAHPQCMSHGLTLTEASTIVWFGPPSSLETFEQANARITRPGQKFSQLILMLVSSRVESGIYTRYERRAERQGLLLELFAGQEHLGIEP